MRKYLYSNWAKFIAVILFIVSVTFGVLTVTNGIIKYDSENEQIYHVKTDFYNSPQINNLVKLPENIVFETVFQCFRMDPNGDPSDKEIIELIQKNLDENNNIDKINYFVQWNDLIITNCEAESAKELFSGTRYSYIERKSNGGIRQSSSHAIAPTSWRSISNYDSTSTIIAGCNIKEEVLAEYKALWNRQKANVVYTCVMATVCAVVALLLLIYLICVCGVKNNGEYKNMWLDNVWSEVHLATVAATLWGLYCVCIYIINELYDRRQSEHWLIFLSLGITVSIVSAVLITSLLSVVRNIKTQRLSKTSIILRIIKRIWRLFVRIVKWICSLAESIVLFIFRKPLKKTSSLCVLLFIIYTVLIILAVEDNSAYEVWLFIGILAFVAGCIIIARKAKDLDAVKNGVSEVRSGNTSYVIPKLRCSDMRILAENINNIAKGVDEAVSAKVKAEKLKSELITNVSHDLKTPITSIINYSELLSKVEGLPEEATDYATIIAKKSYRLKNLTQDLFDISKVSSGNDEVNLEKLDVALLVEQALAEHDNEIQRSELTFCTNTQKELFVMADGKKMSRALGNLINNVLKYAMKNTRVFVTAFQKNDNVEIEIKNISAYPLDFDVNEITQRFVRGDESRSTEGHGLGLAIAKSYTEVCNGTFEIVTDGDMFKAILVFKKCD